MNMVIHDLNEREWDKLKAGYEGYEIISKDKSIKPCVGCFGCWLKTPGECVIKDGYECMGEKLSKTEKLVIISKYTYGGFSSFVKNVIDRSISYVLPFLRVIEGETHHKYRYEKKLDLEVIFYGTEATLEIQNAATKYVKAVCLNLGATLGGVSFEKSIESDKQAVTTINGEDKGTVLLNCSLRGEGANSRVFLEKVKENINKEVSLINLSKYLNSDDELVEQLIGAKEIVFAMPLYVDGLPSAVIKLMERLSQIKGNREKNIYVIVNMGFFESKQISNLLDMMKKWCSEVGYNYCGGLAVGAGEMVGPLMQKIPMDKGPVKNAGEALLRMIECIETGKAFDDYYANANGFPRFAYIMIANRNWVRQIKANGMKKADLYRRK